MAQTTVAVSPVDRLRRVSSKLADEFVALRAAVDEAGPLERKYRELINLGAFTTARIEGAFKTHCNRALDAGATPEEIRQACVLPLAATQAIGPVGDALRWADEVLAARG